MAGSNICTRPKQTTTLQTLGFSRQSCNSTVLPPNGLVRVIETSQPAEAPPGDRILITEILNRVATSVGQQKATKDATAAAAADQRDKQCKAWGLQCRQCQRYNHFASVCRAKTRAVQHVASINSPCVESPEGVQHVSYGEYEALNMIEINNVTTGDPHMRIKD